MYPTGLSPNGLERWPVAIASKTNDCSFQVPRTGFSAANVAFGTSTEYYGTAVAFIVLIPIRARPRQRRPSFQPRVPLPSAAIQPAFSCSRVNCGGASPTSVLEDMQVRMQAPAPPILTRISPDRGHGIGTSTTCAGQPAPINLTPLFARSAITPWLKSTS